MAAIFQTTFSNAFSWMKIYEFRLRFHISLLLRVQLIILQYLQIKAWHRSGDKPLSEPTTVSLLTHICVTRPHWVDPSTPCPEPAAEWYSCINENNVNTKLDTILSWLECVFVLIKDGYLNLLIVHARHRGTSDALQILIQYEPKNVCLPDGRRYPALSDRGRLCLQAPLDGTLVTPQYDTPSMWADMN